MLVLTRKNQEGLLIGEVMVFVEIRGGHVKVVVDAPREINISRTEAAGLPNLKAYKARRDDGATLADIVASATVLVPKAAQFAG